MRNNHETNNPITVYNATVEEVREFEHLGSKVTTEGDSEVDVTARINKTRQPFTMMKTIWQSRQLRLKMQSHVTALR